MMDNANGHSRRVPPEKRKRTETSCDKCKTRKQKCDRIPGHTNCRYCEIHGIACSITQPRKKRLYGSAEVLAGRLLLLETLVKGLVPEADLASNEEMMQLGKSLGIPLPNVENPSDGAPRTIARDDDYSLPLLPDQQGQVQYIGPASSFSFHLHLQRLIGNSPACEFAMFGRNAADQESIAAPRDSQNHHEPASATSALSNCSSPSDIVLEIDGSVLDTLIDAYFENIHSDFPVLHEASFREAYEIWTRSSSNTDPAWLCGLLCVLILSRRVAQITIPEEAERKWWRHVQMLLPTVFFTSNMFTVQALMLAALHLHNTSHRDACWNLTGTSVRIAFAIGLHRDDIKHTQSPLGRELRKQLWWTLYSFEHMQVSSYDRPSAIANTLNLVGCPNERIVGVPGHCPQDFMQWSQRLVMILSSACKAVNPLGTGTTGAADVYSAPLSPATGILRELERWKEALPSHLRWEVANSLAPSSQRPLLLLHVQYYYIVILMSRSALLRCATHLSNNNQEQLPEKLLGISDTCVQAGRCLGQLLRKLDDIDKFNATTWWDIFYAVASSLVLVLDVICGVKQQRPILMIDESQKILRKLAATVAKQLENPRVPGSMRTWGTIIIDVSVMATQFVATTQPEPSPNSNVPVATVLPTSAPQGVSAKRLYVTPVPLDAPEDGVASDFSSIGRENVAQSWAHLSFADDSNSALQDWTWDDIGAILRGNPSI